MCRRMFHRWFLYLSGLVFHVWGLRRRAFLLWPCEHWHVRRYFVYTFIINRHRLTRGWEDVVWTQILDGNFEYKSVGMGLQFLQVIVNGQHWPIDQGWEGLWRDGDDHNDFWIFTEWRSSPCLFVPSLFQYDGIVSFEGHKAWSCV